MNLERKSKKIERFPLNIYSLAIFFSTVLLVSSLSASVVQARDQCLEINNIEKHVSGNNVQLRPQTSNQCSDMIRQVELKAGSNSTGYKSIVVDFPPYETNTYEFEFKISQKEIFEVSLLSTITGENIIEPRHVEIEPRPTLEGEDRNVLINFILNNIATIIGIIIITIIGVILITPFIHNPERSNPFEGEITLEDLKKE